MPARVTEPLRSIAAAAGLALLIVSPALAQDSAPGRLTAYITNRYLKDFNELRLQIAQFELLGACGEEELTVPLLERIIVTEATLKRAVIADVDQLTNEGLPDAATRRDLAITLLDAFGLVDSSTRGLLFDEILTPPAPEKCEQARAAAQDLLPAPE